MFARLTWMQLKESSSAFSLQNCSMILITLHARQGDSVSTGLTCYSKASLWDARVPNTHSVASISSDMTTPAAL